MNVVPQFHYALISGPSTGWTSGGTRIGWGQDRQILFEGTERERQGQKNSQQKDDRSTCCCCCTRRNQKRLHRREPDLQNVSKQPSVPLEEHFRAKLFHNRYDRKYLLAVPTKARILCLDSL